MVPLCLLFGGSVCELPPLLESFLEYSLDRESLEDRLYEPEPAPRPTTSTYRGLGSDVEKWRALVGVYFRPEDVERALCLMSYESGGNPDARNPSSSASGLFQHLPKYWAERSTRAGWSGADIFDPIANIAVAAWLRDTSGGWFHWAPYGRGLCH